jgi:hypothetical protein
MRHVCCEPAATAVIVGTTATPGDVGATVSCAATAEPVNTRTNERSIVANIFMMVTEVAPP